ncbi:hypothetical protein JCM19241_3073 [Vibrio ishigakensis]|uniref:Uncharacterized protein n=1 Tax=Vibrio ishigakensis TaxID=1481914 RepID=A0A0B8QEK8_9VIBR|nr:hypothetical protein JCM19241_3073 [Vibrio ishigakensis]
MPLKLLTDTEKQTHFRSALRGIMASHESLETFGINIEGVTRQFVSRLPEVFQKETSIKTISNLVDNLMKLVSRYSLNEQDQPASYLNNQLPNWREVFPFPLETNSGTNLLDSLLYEASEEVKRKVVRREQRLSCQHFMSQVNQSINTELLFPKQLQFESSDISGTRVELGIFEAEKQIASLGGSYFKVDGGKCLLRMPKSQALVKRNKVQSELYLKVTQAGSVLAEYVFPNSSLALGESPVGFIRKNQRLEYVGQSSFTTKQSKLLVVLPFESELNCISGDFEYLDKSFQDFSVIDLSGLLEVSCNGDNYRLESGAKIPFADSFEFFGQQLAYSTKPAQAYIELPKVKHTEDIEGFVPQANLYVDGVLANSINNADKFGVRTLSLKNSDGHTLTRKRAGILPRDFSITTRSGVLPTEGCIHVNSQQPFIVNVAGQDISFVREKSESGCQLYVKAQGKPPARITLQIQPSLLAQPIEVTVPFPAKGALGYDSNDNPLEQDLYLDNLLGSRLYLFSEEGRPTQYKVSLVLKETRSPSSTRNAPRFDWSYTVDSKPLELSLFSLKEKIDLLLSLSDSLDATVEVQVSTGGSSDIYRVWQYKGELEFIEERGIVRLADTNVTGDISPVLVCLSQPENAIPLKPKLDTSGIDLGDFELPSFVYDTGPWLVVPSSESQISFRAKFLVGGAEKMKAQYSAEESVTSLSKAVVLYHPRFNPTTIDSVVEQMSTDFNHKGWGFVQVLYKKYSHLPLETFEVWKAIAKNPQAVAMAAFKFDMAEDFLDALETAFPIFWAFIPVQCWKKAREEVTNHFSKLLPSEELVETVVDGYLDKLSSYTQLYDQDYLALIKSDEIPELHPKLMMQMLIQGVWLQELMRSHSSDDNWPKTLGHELNSWFSDIEEKPCELVVPNSYQYAVAFLPIYAAAVSAGVAEADSIFRFNNYNCFYIKQIRAFDSEWFEPLYRYSLQYFLQNKKG